MNLSLLQKGPNDSAVSLLVKLQRFTTTRRNLLASSAFSNFLAAVSSSIRKSVEPLECFFFRSLPSLLRCQANG
jgi:hypothetical protein